MKMVRRVGERGVVTIPKEARQALGILEGDLVEFEIYAVYPADDRPAPHRMVRSFAQSRPQPAKSTTEVLS